MISTERNLKDRVRFFSSEAVGKRKIFTLAKIDLVLKYGL